MSAKRVVISGASGLIGGALTDSLRRDGVEAVHLVRRTPEFSHEVQWDPGSPLNPGVLEGATAVVNLNGASIARLPWTRSYRRTLRTSRLTSTRTLARALAEIGDRAGESPKFISASAVGFYGSQPGTRLTEESTHGDTFLARLCGDWEHEALEAGPHARVALLRTASLLHPKAVLKPLILLTRFGLGGPLGSGTQQWPWISLEDEVRAIRHIIDHDLTGPINLSGPHPARANDIGRAVAALMRRPFLLRAPGWALRLGLGRDAADSLLLADAQVAPTQLLSSGFSFVHEHAETAIKAALTRSAP